MATKEIYLAGGCFWGTEHFFKQIAGVTDTETGFGDRGGSQEVRHSSRRYLPYDQNMDYQRSKEHLLEKYAEGGYMRLWLNSERNQQGLENLRAIIRDESRLRALCEKCRSL